MFNIKKANSNIKKDFYGDIRELDSLYYSKKDQCRCVYCGRIADSRDHIPSKCFLSRPFPNNLGVLPSCEDCNNSFSILEAKVSRLTKWIKHYIEGETFLSEHDLSNKYKYLENRYSSGKIERIVLSADDKDAIEKIAFKLAFGHFIYLGSSFYSESDMKIRFKFSFQCSEQEIGLFNENHTYLQNMLPELGSRGFELCVSNLNHNIQSITTWNVVQRDNYRFLINWDGYILIVIQEVLFITVELI